MGKLPCAAPSFPSHGTCSVCVSVLLTPQSAWWRYSMSGCLGYPVVLLPWQHWLLLIHPTPFNTYLPWAVGIIPCVVALACSMPGKASLERPVPCPSQRSFCLLLPVPGFAWTGVAWTPCFSQHVAEMGTDLLLHRAWSQGSRPTPGRKVGVPAFVLFVTLPKLPDVSQGHGHGPTLFIPTQRCSFGRELRVTLL